MIANQTVPGLNLVRKSLLYLLLALICPALWGNEGEPPTESDAIHWGLSSFLGTGWYQVNDNLSVFALLIPPRQTVQESWFESREDRGVGIDIKYNTTLGVYTFDDLSEAVDLDNVGMFSFTPGVQLEIPVTRDFYLRAFGHFGWGKEFETDSTAWIWYGGVKGRYRFPQSSNDLTIIGYAHYGGYNPSDSRSEERLGLGLGMEGSIPFRSWSYRETTIDLDWHAMYTNFSNSPVFKTPQNGKLKIEQLLEFGLALSPRDGNWNLGFWEPERLGIGLKWDPDSEFLALTVNFTSWFDR